MNLSALDITPLVNLLKNPNNLLIVLALALGWFFKYLPYFPIRWVRTTVILVTMIVAPFFLSPIPSALVLGFIYGALATVIYDYLFAWIEDKARAFFGKPTPAPGDDSINRDMLSHLPPPEQPQNPPSKSP